MKKVPTRQHLGLVDFFETNGTVFVQRVLSTQINVFERTLSLANEGCVPDELTDFLVGAHRSGVQLADDLQRDTTGSDQREEQTAFDADFANESGQVDDEECEELVRPTESVRNRFVETHNRVFGAGSQQKDQERQVLEKEEDTDRKDEKRTGAETQPEHEEVGRQQHEKRERKPTSNFASTVFVLFFDVRVCAENEHEVEKDSRQVERGGPNHLCRQRLEVERERQQQVERHQLQHTLQTVAFCWRQSAEEQKVEQFGNEKERSECKVDEQSVQSVCARKVAQKVVERSLV